MPWTKLARIFSVSGEQITDSVIISDYSAAVKFGPYRVGEHAFFFRERLRQVCLPYDSFDHVFKRAMLCASRTCGKVVHTDTFWLVFCRGADEVAEAKTIDEKHCDGALELLRSRLPGAEFGK